MDGDGHGECRLTRLLVFRNQTIRHLVEKSTPGLYGEDCTSPRDPGLGAGYKTKWQLEAVSIRLRERVFLYR